MPEQTGVIERVQATTSGSLIATLNGNTFRVADAPQAGLVVAGIIQEAFFNQNTVTIAGEPVVPRSQTAFRVTSVEVDSQAN